MKPVGQMAEPASQMAGPGTHFEAEEQTILVPVAAAGNRAEERFAADIHSLEEGDRQSAAGAEVVDNHIHTLAEAARHIAAHQTPLVHDVA